ncbi:MAG TPA: acyl-CoA dehydrogenase family protein [Gaiellales bacterium]|jgi:alkylation response protein AidB-like acyl-CoA dehydrogenase
MDLALTPELLEIQQRSRRFCDEHLLPVELQCELENGLPGDVLQRIHDAVIDARLHAVNMPVEWGGQGLSWLAQVISQEQLGRSTNALWDVVWRPANVLRHCNDEQRARYLIPEIAGDRRYAYAVTEPGAGSDASTLQTRATRIAGGWRIDGEKWFVTAADVADYLIVVADAEGHGPTAFLVDQGTPGLRETRRPRYMHTFVYEHPEYVLEGCEVADAQVLGGLGHGHALSREWFVEERLMIAARCLGGAQRVLEVALEYAGERVQFGQRIADFQGVSFPLASSAVELAAARSFVYQVAWDASRGLDPKTLHAKASAIKLYASEMAGRVVDRALQVLGGRGYMRENPVERLYRDLRVDRIWEGTSEIQRVVVANELTKRGASAVTGWPVP